MRKSLCCVVPGNENDAARVYVFNLFLFPLEPSVAHRRAPDKSYLMRLGPQVRGRTGGERTRSVGRRPEHRYRHIRTDREGSER